MKEVLTKKFWQDVKKTFDEARADTPPTETKPEASKAADATAPSKHQPVSNPTLPPDSKETHADSDRQTSDQPQVP